MGRAGGSREYVLAHGIAVTEQAMDMSLALELARIYVTFGAQPFPVGRAKGMKRAVADRMCRDGWVDLDDHAETAVAFRATPTSDPESLAPYELAVTPTASGRSAGSYAWGRLSEQALALLGKVETTTDK